MKTPTWARRRAQEQTRTQEPLNDALALMRSEMVEALRDMRRFGVGGEDYNGSSSHFGLRTTYGAPPIVRWLVKHKYAVEKAVPGDATYYTLTLEGQALYAATL